MTNAKMGRPSKERIALIRNQVTYLLWNGKLETTIAKAKSVAAKAEKIITLAINSYKDTVTVKKDVKDANGVKIATSVVNDGVKKLNARRKIMSFVYDIQEQRKDKETLANFEARTKDINHPLIEKIFNVYAPKYAERAEKLGQGGGYTRIIKLDQRRGDASQKVLIELI